MKAALAVAVVMALVAATTAGAASLITGKQIRNSSVTGKDVKNNSLTQKDIKETRGYVITTTAQVAPGGIEIISADCDPGGSVISGGWSMDTGGPFVDKTYDDASWSVGVDNFDSSLTSDVEVHAYCAPTGRILAASAGRRDRQVARDEQARRDARSHG